MQGPVDTGPLCGNPVMLRAVARPNSLVGLSKYRVAPNMLVYVKTSDPTELLSDGSRAPLAFTQCDNENLPESDYKCIGISVNGVDTNSDDAGQRVFTFTAYGPAVIATDFKAIAAFCSQHFCPIFDCIAQSPDEFSSPLHSRHRRCGTLAELLDDDYNGPRCVLLEADETRYNKGGLVFFTP